MGLADWAMPRATGLVWIDLPLDKTIENVVERGTGWWDLSPESVRREKKESLDWVTDNFSPNNVNWCSQYFYGHLFAVTGERRFGFEAENK